MHVCRYLLVSRLEAKEMNLYTKKHMCGNDGLELFIFWNEGVVHIFLTKLTGAVFFKDLVAVFFKTTYVTFFI
jgi:hypothetical protein